MDRIASIGSTAGYWLALVVLGSSLEATALYYQYGLQYYPCVLCIHVRIWLAGLILVSAAVLPLRRFRPARIVAHLLTVVIAAALLERSWRLLGIERGWLESGECNFDAGLPAWLALDQWFPKVFGVQEACGYTPELPFGVTMAEALVVLSVVLLLVFAALSVAELKSGAGRRGS